MGDPGRYTDVDAFRHHELGIANWASMVAAWDHHWLGPTGAEGSTEWAIRNGKDGSLYEVTAFGTDGVTLKRRTGGDATVTFSPEAFTETGPWFRPGNDTTAALWHSKFDPEKTPDVPEPEDDVEVTLAEQDDILDWLLSETRTRTWPGSRRTTAPTT